MMDRTKGRAAKRSTIEHGRWLLISLVVLLAIVGVVVQGAHSRHRNVVRREAEPRYDRSITTFSANGRLAQVEYGMEASLRGSAIAAMKMNNGEQAGICLVIQNSSFGKVHRIDHHLWLVTACLSCDARDFVARLPVP